MITIYKNDPKYKKIFMSKNQLYYTGRNCQISKDSKNTKSHFLEILIKLIQSGVKSVYDKG